MPNYTSVEMDEMPPTQEQKDLEKPFDMEFYLKVYVHFFTTLQYVDNFALKCAV